MGMVLNCPEMLWWARSVPHGQAAEPCYVSWVPHSAESRWHGKNLIVPVGSFSAQTIATQTVNSLSPPEL